MCSNILRKYEVNIVLLTLVLSVSSSIVSSTPTAKESMTLWRCTFSCRAYGTNNFECQQKRNILSA